MKRHWILEDMFASMKMSMEKEGRGGARLIWVNIIITDDGRVISMVR